MFIFYIGIPDKSLTYLLFKKMLFGVIRGQSSRAYVTSENIKQNKKASIAF